MEVHTVPAAAKRMWSYLRAVFFMVRKGVLSNKRKLFFSMHLLMKRRNKAVARTVASLLSHHGGHGAVAEEEEEYPRAHGGAASPARIEYYAAAAAASPAPSSPEEEYDCAPSPTPAGGFSVRVSNYSSEDEGAGSDAVDDEAEEFIRRFYEQLRNQNQIALLPYLQESAA